MDNLNTLLGGGAIIGALIAGWNYIKVYLSKIYGTFFVRIKFDGDDLRYACTLWSFEKCKKSRITLLNFLSMKNFVKPLNKTQLIAFEQPSEEPTIYWLGYKPIIITNGKELVFIRWTFNANELVKEMVDFYNEKLGDGLDHRDRFYIRRHNGSIRPKDKNGNNGIVSDSPTDGKSAGPPATFNEITEHLPLIGWKKDDIGQPKRPDPISYLALSNECTQAIDDLKLWRKSEKWYKDRFIPWKKGILTYGKPGNGKSSFAKALAMELNMPIMIFNITDMNNTDFQDSWSSVKNNTPCMVLLEDIDSVFDGRKNIAHEDGGLSFDCLLNCIDGVENSDGILIVATTNNIEKIDVALGKPNGDDISTRPGRIDRALELTSPNEEGRRKIAKRILIDYPDHVEKLVKEGHNDSGAQFQERCSRLALKLFWNK